ELLTIEEEGFLRTLRRGGNILSAVVEKAEKSPRKEISGEEAFKLKDTYGFPLEEIMLIARDHELSVNLDAYTLLEKEAKERSRKAKGSHAQLAETTIYEEYVKHHGPSSFVGYDQGETSATIKGILLDGKLVNTLEEGQEGQIILDQTPFYPEKGGQVGDQGSITHKGAAFQVTDCRSPYPEVITHHGTLKNGTLIVGEPITAMIDQKRRSEIAKHHSATHLLHYALQKVLGSHIRQAGSLVEATRLRFDFNHHKGLTQEELRSVESLVNEKIWENSSLHTYELKFEEVQNHPEIKQFFGDKYGAVVRVVDIASYSKELCGGTHVNNVGEIGYFRIAKEGSIAKGVRRIEAVIGASAEALRYSMEDKLTKIAHTLKATLPKVEESLDALVKENEALKEKALFARKKHLNDLAGTLLTKVKQVGGIPILSAVVDVEKKELLELGNDLEQRMKSGVIFLCLIEGEQCQLFLKVSPDLVERGIHANTLIKGIADLVEGSGGGKKDTAQAGGKNPKGVIIAFEKIQELVKSRSE
ncbi:MAG: alanine--tRNA ligase, partial [Chlamydiia bacterium]|nr:alanine--tRNA ligase [Chlamydiia bacterium]